MAIRTRDLMREWRAGDADRLARFMNQTGRGWPGGGWDPKESEEIARHIREQELLGLFVAEVGDKIVSLCNVRAKPGQRNQAYVPFLTADPDFHGKGYGKAVLLRAVERVYQRGIGRVDLGTWAGNMKAVPLYKKSGFMWSPESGAWGVHMENFTPGARRDPLAREFFRKHDWYQTMKRDLSLKPDEHKRGKVRVYEYLWEEDGDRLRMVYDRRSWGLLEIETNELLVGCFLEEEKLVAGLPQRVRWRIVNHRKSPREIVLMASADEGVKLSHKQVLRVAGEAELDAEFEIDPEIPDKEKEPRAPIIRTELLVDGKPITLEAGFEAKQAVHFGLDGDGHGLRPGRAERVVVQAWNELDRRAEAMVRVTGPAGTRVEGGSATLRLPAKGSAEMPVSVTTDKRGSYRLTAEATVKAGGRTIRPKVADLWVDSLKAGDVVGHVEKDRVVLESTGLRVYIHRRGGWTSVMDKVRNRWEVAAMGAPQLGPPFSWDEFFESRCEARVEQAEGGVVAVVTTPSLYRPGVRLERRIRLSNLPVIEVDDTLVNASGSALSGRLRVGARLRGDGGTMAVPTAQGIVRDLASSAGRSPGEHRFREEGREWPEGWIGVEDAQGVTTGMLWESARRIQARGGWNDIERDVPAAQPGESISAGPVYLFVGEGDYFTVRRWWQTLFGPRVDREERRPETRQPLRFGLSPRPVVVHGRAADAKLLVESVGRLELAGTLTVQTPEGVRVRPSRMSFRRASGKRVRAERVTITRKPGAPEAAYAAECTARLDRAVYGERQPIIVLGDPKAKVVVEQTGEEEELFRADNGVITLTVAPKFQGAAISLRREGRELVRSAYPEARPLAWENPWFGGIQPRLGGMARHELLRERVRARAVRRVGSQGIVWQGVRVSWSPKQERARHSGLAVDYLLAPGSGIFAVTMRTTRRTDTAGWVDASFDLFPILGGSHLDAVLRGQADGRAKRIRCEFGGWVRGDRWVMAENPKTGEAVLLAGRGGEAGTYGQIFGRDGYFLGAGYGATHEAREMRESVYFVSFTSADRAQGLAEALSELKGLP